MSYLTGSYGIRSFEQVLPAQKLVPLSIPLIQKSKLSKLSSQLFDIHNLLYYSIYNIASSLHKNCHEITIFKYCQLKVLSIY